jgi:hypothetical protein
VDNSLLEFDKPLVELQRRIDELKALGPADPRLLDELRRLERELEAVERGSLRPPHPVAGGAA